MPQISLTASMRSNLLSLQNISGQVSHTQNRLATGKKVNSAIDNPSSFYTASSLNNRARDLDALLDAMSQATSTIKAATTTLETATNFLEQASAVATQALETAIPAKEYFENLVGENGAVVSTAQELKDAVNSGKETICVYGKIDYFENERIKLKDGQNLVGTEYFTGYTGKEKFSQIHFSGNQNSAIYVEGSNIKISDLNLEYVPDNENKQRRMLYIYSSNVSINNVNLRHNLETDYTTYSSVMGIFNSSIVNFSGVCNIEASEDVEYGIQTTTAQINIEKNAHLNIKMGDALGATGINYSGNTSIDVYGTMNIDSHYRAILMTSENNLLNIHPNATLNIKSKMVPIGINVNNMIDLQAGSRLNICVGSSAFEGISRGYISEKGLINNVIPTLKNSGCFTELSPSIDWDNWQAVEEIEKDTSTEDAGKQYSEILNQYDGLINDASYKGINLLKQDDLKVNFNEKNSSSLEVKGKDMSTTSLGFATQSWANQGDIAQSLKEIASGIQAMRSYNAELGNNYSIITSRQDFTENLINILTEGADKLTLADMNEEGANMLALQTRQQLAINSLSLASQASQSILKLF